MAKFDSCCTMIIFSTEEIFEKYLSFVLVSVDHKSELMMWSTNFGLSHVHVISSCTFRQIVSTFDILQLRRRLSQAL